MVSQFQGKVQCAFFKDCSICTFSEPSIRHTMLYNRSIANTKVFQWCLTDEQAPCLHSYTSRCVFLYHTHIFNHSVAAVAVSTSGHVSTILFPFSLIFRWSLRLSSPSSVNRTTPMPLSPRGYVLHSYFIGTELRLLRSCFGLLLVGHGLWKRFPRALLLSVMSTHVLEYWFDTAGQAPPVLQRTTRRASKPRRLVW